MLEPARVTLHRSSDIPAPPDAVWEPISDRAGMLRWRLPQRRAAYPAPNSYTKSDDATVSGYVATTHVDAREIGASTVHITSTFDVSAPAHHAAAVARYAAIYAAMFRAYRHYFTSAPADDPSTGVSAEG